MSTRLALLVALFCAGPALASVDDVEASTADGDAAASDAAASDRAPPSAEADDALSPPPAQTPAGDEAWKTPDAVNPSRFVDDDDVFFDQVVWGGGVGVASACLAPCTLGLSYWASPFVVGYWQTTQGDTNGRRRAAAWAPVGMNLAVGGIMTAFSTLFAISGAALTVFYTTNGGGYDAQRLGMLATVSGAMLSMVLTGAAMGVSGAFAYDLFAEVKDPDDDGTAWPTWTKPYRPSDDEAARASPPSPSTTSMAF